MKGVTLVSYYSGQFQVSPRSDWFKLVLSIEALYGLKELINDYLSLTTNELFTINKNEKEKEEERHEITTFYDDIRSGSELTIITDNIEGIFITHINTCTYTSVTTVEPPNKGYIRTSYFVPY